MKESFEKIENEFYRIKSIGWIKSIRKGPTGIDRTFEFLIGKDEDNFCFPDYLGIEIKTKRFKSSQRITLLSLEPDGESFFEICRIQKNYGYPSKSNPQFKIFYITVSTSRKLLLENNSFSIKVDYKKEKVYLVVFNNINGIIDHDTYWSFSHLEQAVNRKLQYLVLIKAKSILQDKDEYFKYEKIFEYKRVDFRAFLKLLENGKSK